MTKEQKRYYFKKMTEAVKLPCLWCEFKFVRGDMPRVGICKICCAKKNKNWRELGTWWDLFFNKKPNGK